MTVSNIPVIGGLYLLAFGAKNLSCYALPTVGATSSIFLGLNSLIYISIHKVFERANIINRNYHNIAEWSFTVIVSTSLTAFCITGLGFASSVASGAAITLHIGIGSASVIGGTILFIRDVLKAVKYLKSLTEDHRALPA